MDIRMVVIEKTNPTSIIPEKMTEASAGYDIFACIEDPVVIDPLERALITTGFRLALPLDTEAQIRPRSGLAWKNGITVLNAPGTIDSDYRGEVKVMLINLGSEEFTITNGMRIAQMVIAGTCTVRFLETEILDNTDRGTGGFGSTGIGK